MTDCSERVDVAWRDLELDDIPALAALAPERWRVPFDRVALLRFKHALYPGETVVPAAHESALRFLCEHGARETVWALRMVLGAEAAWRPEWIFARASGYCG